MINLNHIPVDEIRVLKEAVNKYSFLLGNDKTYDGEGFAGIVRGYCEQSTARVAMCAMIEKYICRITHKSDGKVVILFKSCDFVQRSGGVK